MTEFMFATVFFDALGFMNIFLVPFGLIFIIKVLMYAFSTKN